MDIACGRWHTVAHVDGKDPVYCWGLNHRGQCGLKQYMPGAAFTPSSRRAAVFQVARRIS